MKCNLKKTNSKDIRRLYDELRKLRCYKCGQVIKVCESPIFMIYEQPRKQLCKKCKGGE